MQRAKWRDSHTKDWCRPALTSLLTRRGRWGVGAEAWASEVKSQGEDWGGLREHSLKGASAPRLAGSVSGEKSGPVEKQKTFVLGVREERGFLPSMPTEAEHRLSELQRWVRATAISSDPRDGHELLRLLLLPRRILSASTGQYPQHPRSLCSPPLQGS